MDGWNIISITGAVGLMGGLLLIWMFNHLAGSRNRVRQSFADLETQLKRRLDLIPNLVAAVRSALNHEREVLTQVIEMRNEAAAARGVDAVGAVNSKLNDALVQLKALVENYPEVKANKQVADFMEELTSTENRISFSRQAYNDLVRVYNNQLDQFPSNMVARFFTFRRARFLRFDTAVQEPPKVQFD